MSISVSDVVEVILRKASIASISDRLIAAYVADVDVDWNILIPAVVFVPSLPKESGFPGEPGFKVDCFDGAIFFPIISDWRKIGSWGWRFRVTVSFTDVSGTYTYVVSFVRSDESVPRYVHSLNGFLDHMPGDGGAVPPLPRTTGFTIAVAHGGV